MRVGKPGRFRGERVGFSVALALALASPGAARADHVDAGVVQVAPTEARADAGYQLMKEIEGVRAEPGDTVTPVAAEPHGTRIAPAAPTPPGPLEERFPPPEPDIDRPETIPALTAAQITAMNRDPRYRTAFADLRACRDEIALARHVNPREVTAGGVRLRWTVDGDGDVTSAEVIETHPTDPDVMTCVHRKLAAWQIRPTPDEPFRASRDLHF